MSGEGNEKPKKAFITKAEFATYLGVNRSQVTRAVQSGRIRQTAKGLIRWREAEVDWEQNRTDTLAGTGRAQNKVPKLKDEELPAIPQPKRMDALDELDELDMDDGAPLEMPSGGIGKPPPKNTRAYEEYLERKAKRKWAEMRVEKERGKLLERDDVTAIYGAVLTALKAGLMSLPQRTTIKAMGLVRKWLSTHNITVEEGAFVILEKEIEQAIVDESNFVLTDVAHKIATVEEEADKVAERQKK